MVSCHVGHTGTHLITDVKQRWAWLVLWWVTTQITSEPSAVRSIVEFRGGGYRGYGFLGWGGIKSGGSAFFQQGRKKTSGIRAILCTLGVQKAQKSLQRAFLVHIELFKSSTLGFKSSTLGFFLHFSWFFADLVDFLLHRRFSRKGRGCTTFSAESYL
jgi:hypothetical protein